MEIEKHFGLYDATCTTKNLEIPINQLALNVSASVGVPLQQVPPIAMVGDPLTRTTETMVGDPLTRTTETMVGDPLTRTTETMVGDPLTRPQETMVDVPHMRTPETNVDDPYMRTPETLATPGKPLEGNNEAGKPSGPTGKDCTI
ncbi:unnamed protein product [Peronospora farinosa]|nr:unnamed protein product [Peronospora farinosa]